MPTQAERFADNWAYLKTELQWLDRVLMLAVARQRQETKEVDRFAQSRADRVTSHWWKGIMSFKEDIAYDEHRPQSQQFQSTGKPSSLGYQQQLEHRIQVSREQGVFLGLPSLRDRLNLTLFEKNLVLLGLAPEINRRYAKIYRYLQGDDLAAKTDLPTVDLVLRLLCRNDVEWRTARIHLTTASPLLQYNLLKLVAAPNETLLNYPVKLADPLVDYLLAEQPTPQALDILLSQFIAPLLPVLLSKRTVNTSWTDLILPEPLHNTLQLLSQQTQYAKNSTLKPAERDRPGTLALLVGATGTGKTTAAEAIAHSLDSPLWEVDLSRIDSADFRQLFAEIEAEAPAVLLIRSAHLWLGRSTPLSQAEIHRFLDQRQQIQAITLLTAPFKQSVRLSWQRRFDRVLEFSLPSRSDRLKLWQRAFSDQISLDCQTDWEDLAQLKLTGGEIGAIAYDAVLNAALDDSTLNINHLVQALKQSGKSLSLKPPHKNRQSVKQILKEVPMIADSVVKDDPIIQDEPVAKGKVIKGKQPAQRKSATRKSTTRDSANSAKSPSRKNSKQTKDNIA